MTLAAKEADLTRAVHGGGRCRIENLAEVDGALQIAQRLERIALADLRDVGPAGLGDTSGQGVAGGRVRMQV